LTRRPADDILFAGMRQEKVVWLGVVVGALAVTFSAAVSMFGQGPTPTPARSTPVKTSTSKAGEPAKAGPAPRAAWGQPDLQGTWFVEESIPLERSAANANKEYLTDAEVAAADSKKAVDPGRNARSANVEQDVTGAYNAVFNSVLKTGHRTSLIIDPPDGRIPPLVNGAQGRGGRGGGGRGLGGGGRGGAGRGGPDPSDNPETVGQEPGGSGMVRCFGVTTPFMPDNTLFAQGTVMQIVQSPKSLGIYMEDDHSGGGNRIVYMDGSPHLPADIKLYLGDSRGHWEGNTLVIETTNFQEAYRGADPSAFKMTERLTRLDADTLRREITFDDPKTWTRPWTVRIDMRRGPADRHMIFDSACHEGNYGMVGILVGARREEQKAAPGK
jgi:hypothetical protein